MFLLLVGIFELDLTSYLFYIFITVVSTILLYHMYGRWFILYGRWFILFFLRFNIGRSTDTRLLHVI